MTVTVNPEDVRNHNPSFTGNFRVAGEPTEKDLSNAKRELYVINFSLNWSNYKGKDASGKAKYSEGYFVNASIFASSKEELEQVRTHIKRKADIHVTKSEPSVDKWEKNGQKFQQFKIVVKEFYPYHLWKTKEGLLEQKTGTASNADTGNDSPVDDGDDDLVV